MKQDFIHYTLVSNSLSKEQQHANQSDAGPEAVQIIMFSNSTLSNFTKVPNNSIRFAPTKATNKTQANN
jgi:hypothetical protein